MSTDKYLPDTEGLYVPRVAIAIIGILLVGILILVVRQMLGPRATIPNSNEVIVVSPLAPSKELTVITENDVTVYVPPNATNRAGSIFISPAEPNQLVADDPDWIRVKVVNVEFQGADGMTVPDISLFRPIEVCFTLTEEQWTDFNSRPGYYQVQYYAVQKTQPRWENLPKVTYPDQRYLCGQTYRLSLFSVAIMVDAEIPVTGPTTTATATAISINTTRTPAPPVETRERRERDTAVPAGQAPTQPPPTDRPPTQPPPTNPPPTQPPPTNRPPTQPPPTNRPPTQPPPTNRPPTQPPPTDVPPTQPPPTNRPPTQPPPTNPPPTQPPPTNRPPTQPPPPTDPPPTDPPPQPTDPPEPPPSGGNNGNNGNGPPPGHGPPGGPPGQNKP